MSNQPESITREWTCPRCQKKFTRTHWLNELAPPQMLCPDCYDGKPKTYYIIAVDADEELTVSQCNVKPEQTFNESISSILTGFYRGYTPALGSGVPTEPKTFIVLAANQLQVDLVYRVRGAGEK